MPYRAGYRAQLHNLDAALDPDARRPNVRPRTAPTCGSGSARSKQVGDHFELNGRRVNFRGDSLQGANFDNIDFHGVSDAYDTFPGFLKPSAGNAGWPKAVDNYLRLNFSNVRIHQVPATPYMLDVADEMGLMIQDETAIRGSNNRENFVDRPRQHDQAPRRPGEARPQPRLGAALEPVQRAAGRVLQQPRRRTRVRRGALPDGHGARPDATDQHRRRLVSTCRRTTTTPCSATTTASPSARTRRASAPDRAGKPQGQGEFLWYNDSTPQGFTWFGTASMRMREKGAVRHPAVHAASAPGRRSCPV